MRKKKYIIILLLMCAFGIGGYRAFTYYNYTGELVGIKGTNTYHRDNCKFVKKTSSTNLILFATKRAAAEKGYRACKTCNPPDNTEELEAVRAANLNKPPSAPTKWTAEDFK